MRKRKQRAIQPMLEAMETRFMPSATSGQIELRIQHLHHERVMDSQRSEMKAMNHSTVNEQKNNAALQNYKQQLQVVHEHALERTPSAIPTAAEQRATQVNNIFKSLESAL
jgi:hypothetical protein